MVNIREMTDSKQWSDFLAGSKNDNFLQSWEWGEFLSDAGKKIHRLGFFENENLVGICLAQEEISRFGTLVYCPRGPVTEWSNVSLRKEVVKQLVDHLKEQTQPIFIRIDPSVVMTETKVEEELFQLGFHNAVTFWQVERSWMLDLKGKSDEELMQGMRKNARYSLRKSMKSGVEVHLSKDQKEFEYFVEMLYEMAGNKKFAALPKTYLQKQFEHMCLKNEMFRFYTAKLNGEMVAGAVVSFYKKEASYLHGASRNLGDSQAPYLLQWTAITDARDMGIPRYNFWGVVEDKNYHPGYPGFGYSNFKKGFGGYVEQYFRTKDYPVKPLQYNLFRLQEMYRKWRHKGN